MARQLCYEAPPAILVRGDATFRAERERRQLRVLRQRREELAAACKGLAARTAGDAEAAAELREMQAALAQTDAAIADGEVRRDRALLEAEQA